MEEGGGEKRRMEEEAEEGSRREGGGREEEEVANLHPHKKNSPTFSAGRSEQESWSQAGARSTNPGAPARSHCAQWMDGSGGGLGLEPCAGRDASLACSGRVPGSPFSPESPAPGHETGTPGRPPDLRPHLAPVGCTLALPQPRSLLPAPSHQLGLGSGPSCVFIELWILL